MQKIKPDIYFGANIQRLRKEKKLTQDEMCARMQVLGCTLMRTSYVKIEQGTRGTTVQELVAIATILDVSFDEIFKGLKPTN